MGDDLGFFRPHVYRIQAERDRYRGALEEIAGMTDEWKSKGGPDSHYARGYRHAVKHCADRARDALHPRQEALVGVEDGD